MNNLMQGCPICTVKLWPLGSLPAVTPPVSLAVTAAGVSGLLLPAFGGGVVQGSKMREAEGKARAMWIHGATGGGRGSIHSGT